ncbi:MAG: transglutaminaseTgpA domain-containing protein [Verrucomicrobiota bacterium]|nr:transglutaminaseTgpA domain-containing protein [Verrucomicrobiota bacterium]
MKSPLHQLMLVGFLAQGLAWDSWVHWGVSVGLWILAAGMFRARWKIPLMGEGIALVVGCGLAFLIAKVSSRSAHFFLGDGLIVLQCIRMMRPLTRREQVTSLLIACFHIGVACTLAPDVRFAALFSAAILLIPRALTEIEFGGPGQLRHKPGWGPGLVLGACAVLFFISFPRLFVGTALQLQGGIGRQGSFFSSVLDPTGGGFSESGSVLFQVQGERLSYFKCMVLSRFQDGKWQTELSPLVHMRWPTSGEKRLNRKIRIKSAGFLGRVLPTDGQVVFVKGDVLKRPLQTSQGVVEYEGTGRRQNASFEYEILASPVQEPISPALVRYYTRHPEPSARIATFLDELVGGRTTDAEIASAIVNHLQTNFTYRLGAPALSRINTLEDFLFEKREGHCERFASTLALLLRMKGIPSRVVMGYVPGPLNRFTGWHQVRFKDAHSWTEAYLEGRGWVTLDATPGQSGNGALSGFQDFLEGLDLFWYSRVVGFDAAAQRQLFSQWGAMLGNLPGWIAAQRDWLILFFGGALVIACGPRLWRKARAVPTKKSSRGVDAAHEYYSELLKILGKRGLWREMFQTPFEFLKLLEASNHPASGPARVITELFCRAYYSQHALTAAERRSIQAAREELRELQRGT